MGDPAVFLMAQGFMGGFLGGVREELLRSPCQEAGAKVSAISANFSECDVERGAVAGGVADPQQSGSWRDQSSVSMGFRSMSLGTPPLGRADLHAGLSRSLVDDPAPTRARICDD